MSIKLPSDKSSTNYKAEIKRLMQKSIMYRNAAKWLMPLMYSWPICFAIYCLIPISKFPQGATHWVLLLAILVYGLIAGLAGAGLGTLQEKLSRQIEDLIDASGDLTLIGELCATLNGATNSAAVTALVSLLPRLQSADISLLSPEQTKNLCNVLAGNNPRDDQLRISILNAFEQIGTSTTLPYVQKLADGDLSAQRNKAIRVQAQKCLYILSRIVSENDARLELLRPLQYTNSTTEGLLRPINQGDQGNL